MAMNEESQDVMEQTVKYIHIVIPVVGAVMILLMAFIAILLGASNGAWS
jgi:hypothetical protein